MAFPDRYLQSPPVKLHWKGFVGTTHTMQHAGWQFQQYRDERTFCDVITFYHPQHKTYGTFKVADVWNIMREVPKQGFYMDIDVNANLAGDVVVRLDDSITAHMFTTRFTPLDMEPRYVEFFVSKHNIFAPLIDTKSSIIVPEEPSVQDLLDQIIRKQQPAQKAYFEEQVNRKQFMPEAKLCQIIQLRA